MDSLTNTGTVVAALGEFKTSIGVLNKTIESLGENKKAFMGAYESSNAQELFAQYDKLISNLSAAYASLNSYQGKIDGVVNEFIGFDQTLQSGQ